LAQRLHSGSPRSRSSLSVRAPVAAPAPPPSRAPPSTLPPVRAPAAAPVPAPMAPPLSARSVVEEPHPASPSASALVNTVSIAVRLMSIASSFLFPLRRPRGLSPPISRPVLPFNVRYDDRFRRFRL